MLETYKNMRKVVDNNENLYKISYTDLIEIQKTLADMLFDIDEFCNKNQLSYALCGGTCLGSVRHKGFIPWDDDMDICMPRRDYEKFLKLFQKEYESQYWVQNIKMDKKYIPSALVLYLNYFIHGIGCSILSQQVVKEMLASQWGLKDVMAVTSIAAALGLGRLISLPFAGPLSDKLGRRLSVIIGCASYVIFLVGIAFSPNTTIAYIAAVLGGIANSFLDTATYPAVTEIIYKYTGIATMGIKFFISVAQLLMPFFLGVVAGTSMSYLMLPVIAGVCIGIMGILAIFAPFPATSEAGKSESFISNLKNAHFSIESIALILIGFTSTATFQLWLNCAQTFGKEVAGIPSESVSVMQTYYSAGTLVALFITSILITKFKQVRFLVIYPAISVVMLVLVYLIKSPTICYIGAFVIGYSAAGGVLQMATATVNDLFANIKGTITSLVMIASSLCNYTILSAAAKMTATSVIVMNIVITVIGVLLAIFVNMRYGTLLKKANE